MIISCALSLGIFETVFALSQSAKAIPNSGSVKGVNVGIYWNSACTNQTSSISWGTLDSGSNKTVEIYVRNEGETSTILSLNVYGWSPVEAPSYMTVTWNYSGNPVNSGQTVAIQLTLSVDARISGITNFGVTIDVNST